MIDADGASGGRRPDFLIIGAPKCGTTWLTRRLALHPNVAMPDDEIHFFSRHYERGWDWYRSHWTQVAPEQCMGENSNSYLTEPTALSRIQETVPDARFICILRDPVQRAYSSYGMQIDRGRATSDIERYLDPLRSPRPHILANGLYAQQLEPWFQAFGEKQVFVGFFEQIVANPAALYRDVARFLDVDTSFLPPNLTDRENARKAEGVPGPLKKALWWARPWLDAGPFRGFPGSSVGRAAQKALSRPKRYPQLTPGIAERLRTYYASDARKLEGLIGRPLDWWQDGA